MNERAISSTAAAPTAVPTEDEQANQAAGPPVSIAVPTASPLIAPSAQLSPESARSLEGTDAAHTRSTPAPRGRPRHDLAAIREELGPASWHVLDALHRHRFLRTPQLTALLFADGHTPASAAVMTRRTMARLRDRHLVGTLERRIGGMRAGSSGLVWYLREPGHRLIAPDRTQRHRPSEPSTTFLIHTLALGDVHVQLRTAVRAEMLELLTLQVEPIAWRRFLTPAGTIQPLRADLYTELAIPPGSDELLTAFIEVDLGSEHLPTLLRKCRTYAQYYRWLGTAGGAATTGNSAMPLVIWQMSARTPDIAQRRRQQLADGIARDPRLDPRMFRITSPDHLVTTLCQAAEQEGDTV